MVGAHVGQRGGNATLRSNRVRAGRKHFGDTGSAQPLLGHAQRRAQTRTAGPHHNHIVIVRLVFVSSHQVRSSNRDFGKGEQAGRRQPVT